MPLAFDDPASFIQAQARALLADPVLAHQAGPRVRQTAWNIAASARGNTPRQRRPERVFDVPRPASPRPRPQIAADLPCPSPAHQGPRVARIAVLAAIAALGALAFGAAVADGLQASWPTDCHDHRSYAECSALLGDR